MQQSMLFMSSIHDIAKSFPRALPMLRYIVALGSSHFKW
jgi:hypothetical protein